MMNNDWQSSKFKVQSSDKLQSSKFSFESEPIRSELTVEGPEASSLILRLNSGCPELGRTGRVEDKFWFLMFDFSLVFDVWFLNFTFKGDSL
jgi:hypothetical protein